MKVKFDVNIRDKISQLKNKVQIEKALEKENRSLRRNFQTNLEIHPQMSTNANVK